MIYLSVDDLSVDDLSVDHLPVYDLSVDDLSDVSDVSSEILPGVLLYIPVSNPCRIPGTFVGATSLSFFRLDIRWLLFRNAC